MSFPPAARMCLATEPASTGLSWPKKGSTGTGGAGTGTHKMWTCFSKGWSTAAPVQPGYVTLLWAIRKSSGQPRNPAGKLWLRGDLGGASGQRAQALRSRAGIRGRRGKAARTCQNQHLGEDMTQWSEAMGRAWHGKGGRKGHIIAGGGLEAIPTPAIQEDHPSAESDPEKGDHEAPDEMKCVGASRSESEISARHDPVVLSVTS